MMIEFVCGYLLCVFSDRKCSQPGRSRKLFWMFLRLELQRNLCICCKRKEIRSPKFILIDLLLYHKIILICATSCVRIVQHGDALRSSSAQEHLVCLFRPQVLTPRKIEKIISDVFKVRITTQSLDLFQRIKNKKSKIHF